MRVLIAGARGQLGLDLQQTFADWDVIALAREHLDIQNPDHIEHALARWAPDAVLNAAAYHHVDTCEDEPELSFAVNAAAPQRLAAACARHGVLLVHYSTDYVFDGRRTTPYTEEDPVRPLSVYGASKVAGEMAIRAASARHIIIRTSGLYGQGGRIAGRGNFVETLLRLRETGKTIKVVVDQVLTPTATPDVAATTFSLVRSGAEGTYHVTNSGSCSWYEFAAEVFRLARLSVDLQPTTQQEYSRPARRPSYSVLAHDATNRAGIPELQPWQQALEIYLWERARTGGSETLARGVRDRPL